MALINTIREKSGVAVGAVAVGMLLFIVGGDLIGGRNRLFGRGGEAVIGEVAGQKIELPEFNSQLELAKQNFSQQQGRPPDEQTLSALRDQTWNQLLFRRAFQPELTKLGLSVGPEELVDIVQGDNPSPAIKQAFTNPQTGQFDKAQLQQFLANKNLPPDVDKRFKDFEAGLRDYERPVAKYLALLKNSVYVTTAEARAFDQAQNAKASFRYLFVPYSSVPDSAYKPTDEQLRDYLERHRAKYKVEDGRSLEYYVVSEAATKADSAALRQGLTALVEPFRASTNDSLYARANSEQPYSGAYLTAAQLPAVLTKQGLTVGQVYGPLTVGGSLALFKVTGERPKPTVQASHILFKADAQMSPEAKAAVKVRAQEVLAKIKGGADFAALAKLYGSDGTKDKGGDLGYFDRASMVKPFADAAFGAGGLGLLPNLVETSFGYHIVKVTGKKTEPTYQLASILKNIQPSEATREAAYAKAEQLQASAPTLAAFRALATQDKTLTKQEAKFVGRDAPSIPGLPAAREIVRWAYGVSLDGGPATKVGDVRKFDIGEQHVLAALTDTRGKGAAGVESVRPELTAAVRNELKAKALIAKLNGKTGTLEDLAKAAGNGAQVQAAPSVALAQGTLPAVGFEPEAVGRAFALKPGQKSAPLQGEQGVLVVEGGPITPAPAVADLRALRQQLTQQRQQRFEGQLYEAIKAHAQVVDNRTKFF